MAESSEECSSVIPDQNNGESKEGSTSAVADQVTMSNETKSGTISDLLVPQEQLPAAALDINHKMCPSKIKSENCRKILMFVYMKSV